MLNNITNFFNLIKTGKVKTQLDGTDLLPIGTRDNRFTGQYQPTMIKYSDLVAGMIGGSNGQVLFKDNGIANGAANLYWDKVNERLGIGTSTPAFALDALAPQYGGFRFTASDATFLRLDTTTTNFTISQSNTQTSLTTSNYGPLYFINNGGASIRLSLFANGNFGINTTTDAGFRLDVNGTARVSGNLFVNTGSTPSSGLIIGDNTTASLLAYYSGGLYFKVLNTDAMTLTSGPSGGLYIGAGGLQASYKLDVNGTARVTMGASAEFRLGTSSALPAMLYATGSTSYLMRWKNDGSEVYLQGGTFAVLRNITQEFILQSNFTYLSAGNLAIGTATNAGFKLDVNGTVRVADNNQLGWGNGNYFIANNATPKIDCYVQSSLILTIGQTLFTIAVASRTRDISPSSDNSFDIGGQFGRYRNGWFGGQLKVGDTTAFNASAKLQVDSTTQGFLPPRMTTTEKNAIATPAAGLMVYDNTLNRPCFFNGTSWITL